MLLIHFSALAEGRTKRSRHRQLADVHELMKSEHILQPTRKASLRI
jgi:hypothetical protein